MADHPILFSGPMVRALLAGTKTQTRRVIKSARVFATPEQPAFTLKGADLERALQNADSFRRIDGNGWFWESDAFEWQAPHKRTGWMAHLGFAPGDRLYVREAWYAAYGADYVAPRDMDASWKICPAVDWNYADWGIKGRHRQGMHMPRWASRLTLTVTDVRVQRVQEISAQDSIAEGVECLTCKAMASSACLGSGCFASQRAFSELWDSLNAKRGFGWEVNPWVAATSFTVQRGNIDHLEVAA